MSSPSGDESPRPGRLHGSPPARGRPAGSSAARALATLAVSLASGSLVLGCCSVDDLEEVSRPRLDGVGYLTSASADDRREVLACVAEVASSGGDGRVRSAAIAAACRWLDPASEPDAALRATSLHVLEVLRAQSATELATARLAPTPDPNIHVRVAAVSALGAFRGPVASQALCAALRADEAREVRAACARELGELRSTDPAVSSALALALRDEALEVRLVAARALRATHGVDLGFDADTWRGWLSRRPSLAPAPPASREPAPDLEDEAAPAEGDIAPEDAPREATPMPGAEPGKLGDGVVPPEPHDPTDEPGDEPVGPPQVDPPGGGGR